MNKQTSILILTGLSLGLIALNLKAAPKDCWLDIYDKTELKGATTRITGPVELPNLHKLNNEDWSNRIESLSTSPKAKVVAFLQENFKENDPSLVNHGDAIKAWGEKPESYGYQEIQFGPNHKEHHLGELGFHRNINALIVKCMP